MPARHRQSRRLWFAATTRSARCTVTRAFAAQELMERFAFDVFHHQKEDAFLAFAKISHVNDVRMLNRGRGARLALKPRDCFAFLEVFVQRARQGELFSPRRAA